ncbi:MAG: radical SAM protein, partial [Candidatus Methylopumilus sp.]
MTQLKIFEIFYSLQGESSRVGLPTIFIRLSGCPMRCHYCDTAYAFQGGSMMAIDEIIEAIKKYHTHYVTVTGGEPLAQKETLSLLKFLADQNFKVSLETGGGLSIKEVDPRIKIILDIKTPESGEEKKNYWENLNLIHSKDEIKFVLCSREDYDWAKKI